MHRLVPPLLLPFALLVGCDARIERFEPNEVYALSVSRSFSTPAEAALGDVSQVVEQIFGTPDRPVWPTELLADSDLGSLVDPDRLAQSAGLVFSEEDGTNRGLFRKHCVNCHGLSGSGTGPASLLQDPYPRDFRHGVFKWKSTERTAKPTRDDLSGILRRGIPGTAMPSFSLLSQDEIEALVDYVVYLSVRGEVERKLVAAAVLDLGYEESAPPEPELKLVRATAGDRVSSGAEAEEVIAETVREVVRSWQQADQQVVAVPPAPELTGALLAESIERGRGIFHGQIANCAGCHGPEGNGQAVTLDYDDWSKEYSTRLGLTPTDREAMQPFRDAGALPPKLTKPRRFGRSVLRGGGDPETIYRRIAQGIAGTPMPRVEISQQVTGTGLSVEQAWDLVHYVESLAAR